MCVGGGGGGGQLGFIEGFVSWGCREWTMELIWIFLFCVYFFVLV